VDVVQQRAVFGSPHDRRRVRGIVDGDDLDARDQGFYPRSPRLRIKAVPGEPEVGSPQPFEADEGIPEEQGDPAGGDVHEWLRRRRRGQKTDDGGSRFPVSANGGFKRGGRGGCKCAKSDE
jgi:hypothetical protein